MSFLFHSLQNENTYWVSLSIFLPLTIQYNLKTYTETPYSTTQLHYKEVPPSRTTKQYQRNYRPWIISTRISIHTHVSHWSRRGSRRTQSSWVSISSKRSTCSWTCAGRLCHAGTRGPHVNTGSWGKWKNGIYLS